jgi:hypothetical protein
MPKAQISGSARGVIGRSFLAAREPMATPEKPAKQVITPNIRLTLHRINLISLNTHTSLFIFGSFNNLD